MGLETATYISQLVDTNPTAGDPVSQGDDHIRLIKQVLQDQFPSLGAAAVTATAAQINAVTAKLVSFNGRTATAAVPTEGDYTLELLGDVDLTSPTLGQILMNNGAGQWVNIRPGASVVSGVLLYDGYAGTVTDSIWFTNARRNTVPAAVATIKNNGSGGIGWELTAVSACMVQINMQSIYFSTAGSSYRAGLGVFFSPGSPTATMPSASQNLFGVGGGQADFATDDVGCSVSGATILAAGDKVTVYLEDAADSPDSVTLSAWVLQL